MKMKTKTRRRGLTSVQIRPSISKMMQKYTKEGVSKSELINEALRQYLIEKELHEIREKLVPYARAKGVFTDEDVEKFLK